MPQTKVEDATVAATIFPPLVPGNDLMERGRNGERKRWGRRRDGRIMGGRGQREMERGMINQKQIPHLRVLTH